MRAKDRTGYKHHVKRLVVVLRFSEWLTEKKCFKSCPFLSFLHHLFLPEWAWPGPVARHLIGAECDLWHRSVFSALLLCCVRMTQHFSDLWPFPRHIKSCAALEPQPPTPSPTHLPGDASELASHLSVSLKSRVRRTPRAAEQPLDSKSIFQGYFKSCLLREFAVPFAPCPGEMLVDCRPECWGNIVLDVYGSWPRVCESCFVSVAYVNVRVVMSCECVWMEGELQPQGMLIRAGTGLGLIWEHDHLLLPYWKNLSVPLKLKEGSESFLKWQFVIFRALRKRR